MPGLAQELLEMKGVLRNCFDVISGNSVLAPVHQMRSKSEGLRLKFEGLFHLERSKSEGQWVTQLESGGGDANWIFSASGSLPLVIVLAQHTSSLSRSNLQLSRHLPRLHGDSNPD